MGRTVRNGVVEVVEVRELNQGIAQKFFGYLSLYDGGISQAEYKKRRKQLEWCPYYSDSIELAWLIVEHIRSEGKYKIEISAYPKDELWTIKAYHVDGYSKSCTTSAKTLSHAICLAAMKAEVKSTPNVLQDPRP